MGDLQSVSTTAAAARNAKTRAVTVDAKMINKDIPLFQLQRSTLISW